METSALVRGVTKGRMEGDSLDEDDVWRVPRGDRRGARVGEGEGVEVCMKKRKGKREGFLGMGGFL